MMKLTVMADNLTAEFETTDDFTVVVQNGDMLVTGLITSAILELPEGASRGWQPKDISTTEAEVINKITYDAIAKVCASRLVKFVRKILVGKVSDGTFAKIIVGFKEYIDAAPNVRTKNQRIRKLQSGVCTALFAAAGYTCADAYDFFANNGGTKYGSAYDIIDSQIMVYIKRRMNGLAVVSDAIGIF